MSPDASGKQLDRDQATAQLNAALKLAQTLSDVSTKQGAGTAETGDDLLDEEGAKESKASNGHLTHLLEAVEAWEGTSNTDPEGNTASGEQAGRQPVLLLNGAEGIGVTTPEELVMTSGGNLDLISQRDLQQTTLRRWISNVGKKISLFVHGAPDKTTLKLIAAEGDVQFHAQSGDIEIVGDKNLYLTGRREKVTLTAGQEILLVCAGAYVRIGGGNIEMHCPGAINFKHGGKAETGPTSLGAPTPAMPQAKEPFSEQFVVRDKHTGEPMIYTPYRIEMPDGEVIRGVTDSDGRTVRVSAKSMQNVKLFVE
jgi:type VI secretion system secreted protein VgrG